MTAPDDEVRRHSARVLLLDDDGKVLLFRCLRDVNDPAAGYLWCTPGGGVEPGESASEAAARELAEETGVACAPAELGEAVAVSSGYANVGWTSGVFRNDFFVLRRSAPTIDTSGLSVGMERDSFAEYRWWAADELAATTDTVDPRNLAALITTLAGGPPAHPIRLPWHHV